MRFMEYSTNDSEANKHIAMLQCEIANLRKRNADLEFDYKKILDAVQKKGVLTIADMTKLAIARQLHIQK